MAQDSLPGTTDRRLAGLLTLLAENATIIISGGRIAKEVGVSRSMVWRWVERLRELGVKVKGRPATGYFLEQVPDILTPNMLRQRLKGRLFGKRLPEQLHEGWNLLEFGGLKILHPVSVE